MVKESGALPGSRADASSPQAVSTKGFDPARRQWAERIADQFGVDDPAAIDAIEEGLARGRVLAGGRAKEALKEMLNAADWLVAGLQAAYFRKVPVRDFEERFARYDSARELAASAGEAGTATDSEAGVAEGEHATAAPAAGRPNTVTVAQGEEEI